MAFLPDVQDFMIEKTIPVTKTAEELERLTVDEQLKPIDRAVYLLSSGQEVQRISVVNSLPELLLENYDMCLRRIVPKIREVVRVAAVDTQVASCSVFLEILQRNLVPIPTYSQTFLQTILLCLENKDPAISSAWLDTLLAVIEQLPKDVIYKEIMCKAIAKGQLSQPVPSRLACCQILAKAATKFNPFEVKKDILPIVLSLCQDVEHEVRACMSRLLCPVAEALGVDETKASILPELVELTKDEEIHVRLAGLDTLVDVLPLLDDDAKVSTVIPIFSNYCSQAIDEKDVTLSAIAQHYGKLCEALRPNFSDNQKKEFLEVYKKFCKVGLSRKSPGEKTESKQNVRSSLPVLVLPDFNDLKVEEEEDEFEKCRQCAALNLPTMISFIGPKLFKSELAPTLNQLCDDENCHVRQMVASKFHEIAKLVGTGSHGLITECFIKLLNDNYIQVLDSGLIVKLPETLTALSRHASAASSATESKLNDVLASIVGCRGVIFASNNWRLQESYVSALSCLPISFTSDQIHQSVIPIVFGKLRIARALPVRRAAVRTLLQLMRSNHRLEQRQKLFESLVKEYASGKSFSQRSLFVDICRSALDLYSRSFFKEWFFRPLLALHKDHVPNVRLRLCAVLPRLKAILRHPTDKNLVDLIEFCIRDRHSNERDRDVLEVLYKATAELDSIFVPSETSLKKTREDIEDQKRFEEERHLLEMEEQEKKSEETSKDQKKKNPSPGNGRVNKTSQIPMPKTKGPGSLSKGDKNAIQVTSSSSLSSGASAKDAKMIKSPSATVERSYSHSSSSVGSSSMSSIGGQSGAARRASTQNSPSTHAALTKSRSSIIPAEQRPNNTSQRRTSLDMNSSETTRKK